MNKDFCLINRVHSIKDARYLFENYLYDFENLSVTKNIMKINELAELIDEYEQRIADAANSL